MHVAMVMRRMKYADGGRGGGRQLGDLRMLHAGDGKKRLLDRDYMHGNCRDTR